MRRFLHSLGRALDIAVLSTAILATLSSIVSFQAGWFGSALLCGLIACFCWTLVVAWIRSGSFLQPW